MEYQKAVRFLMHGLLDIQPIILHPVWTGYKDKSTPIPADGDNQKIAQYTI